MKLLRTLLWLSLALAYGSAPALPPTGGATPVATSFAARCATAGVLRCFSFDTTADFSQGAGGGQGAWGYNFGEIPRGGTSDYSGMTRDTTVSEDGASSLRFTFPANSAADVAGAWFANFTNDLSYQVGPGQDIYIQWGQMVSAQLLANVYTQSGGGTQGGWKMADVSAGDTLSCNTTSPNSTICPTTCWDFETVVQNTNQTAVPQMYADCAGPYPYIALSGFTSNVTVQNAVGCLYPSYISPPCVKIQADQWLTYQVHIHVDVWNSWTSTIQLWVALPGQHSQLVIDCSPTATNQCNNGLGSVAGWYLYNSDTSYKIGKVWLLPYATNKDASQTMPVAFEWYDDLIISSQPIPNPGGGTP